MSRKLNLDGATTTVHSKPTAPKAVTVKPIRTGVHIGSEGVTRITGMLTDRFPMLTAREGRMIVHAYAQLRNSELDLIDGYTTRAQQEQHRLHYYSVTEYVINHVARQHNCSIQGFDLEPDDADNYRVAEFLVDLQA